VVGPPTNHYIEIDFDLDPQAILNEPAGFTSSSYLATTRQFTIDAYYAARYPWASQGNNAKSGLLIIYSDAFQPSEFYRDWQIESRGVVFVWW
jgi:hypothetical protein